MLCISPLQIAWDLKALLSLLLCTIELENVMWIIVGNSKFLYKEKKEPLRMCAVWKWHLLYLIILQASAVTKVLWFLFSLQRLRLIEIYDVKRLQLRYATSLIGWGSRDHCFSWFSLFESTFESILSDTLIHCYSFTSTIQHNYTGLCGVTDHSLIYLFSGPSTLATFAAVYALFGPTFPGIYDKERGIYTLFYPVRHDKLLWLFSLFILLFLSVCWWVFLTHKLL